jgi:hypothetical protein
MPKIIVYFPFRVLLLALTVSMIPGCGGGEKKPDGFPPLLPLTITITQDGEPLVEAIVTLVPDSGPMQWGSGGYTDSKGKAVIKTHGSFQGAPAGKYKVTIFKREDEAVGSDGSVTEYYLVDPIYESAETTTCQVEVVSGIKAAAFDVGKAIRINTQKK